MSDMTLIAVCGLNCAECPAYIAFTTDDNVLREKTAKEWSAAYGGVMTAESINCAGCKSETGPHIGHCSQCAVRACGQPKAVDHCGVCASYPCGTISTFMEQAPAIRDTLNALIARKKS